MYLKAEKATQISRGIEISWPSNFLETQIGNVDFLRLVCRLKAEANRDNNEFMMLFAGPYEMQTSLSPGRGILGLIYRHPQS